LLAKVSGVNFGLHCVRRRQRSLAKGVLALFCAAWLQAAIVPCVMAHASESESQQDADPAAPPCPYCPTPDPGPSCDGHGGCAYPHDPQVDARAAGALFTALPVSSVLPSPATPVVAHRVGPRLPAAVPKLSFSVSYCRFIE